MIDMLNGTLLNLTLEANETQSWRRVLKVLSPEGYDVAGTFLACVAFFGIFNNLCVVAAFLRNPSLRTPLNLILVNLSLSDMVLAAYGSPITASAAFYRGWYLGREVCIAEAFGMNICGLASIASLAVVSMERYFLVTKPGSFHITTDKAAVIIFGVWVYAFCLALPPLIGWNRYMLISPGVTCDIDWETSSFSNGSYIIYILVFGLILPLGVIFFSYYHILRVIKEKSVAGAGRGVAKSEQKVTVMVIVMVIAFLIAWMPYTVMSLIVVFDGQHLLSASAVIIPVIFAKMSIVYNPIIYVLLNPPFRRTILSMLTCGRFKTVEAIQNRGRKIGPTSMLVTGNATFHPSVGTAPISNERPS